MEIICSGWFGVFALAIVFGQGVWFIWQVFKIERAPLGAYEDDPAWIERFKNLREGKPIDWGVNPRNTTPPDGHSKA